MLTTRDYEIIDFVKEFKAVDTDTISRLFFPSRSACQKRLKAMHDENVLKRARDSINDCYIYYHKQPKQLRHSLLVSRFYAELQKRTRVLKFSIEPVYDNIRPDAAFVYSVGGASRLGLLEVELSNKGFDWFKYDRFFASENYKRFMTVKPVLFIVSDKVSLRPNAPCKTIIVDTCFQSMRVD